MSQSQNTHETFFREENHQGSSNRSFGVVFIIVFLVIGLWPLIYSDGFRVWALYISGGLALITLIRPTLLAPFNRLWMRFGLLLHKVVNPVVMGLVFFLTVLPTGLIMRMFGKDPLRQKIDKDVASYWIEREPPGPSPNSMKNQF